MKNIIGIIFLCSLLCGCSSSYLYKGKWYHHEELIKETKSDLAITQNKIAPLPKPLVDKCAAALPSIERIKQNMINANESLKGTISEQLNLIFTSQIDAIEKRGICSSVIKQINDDPDNYVFTEDVFVYLSTPGKNKSQWHVKTSSSGPARIIAADNSLDQGYDRLMSWLANLEERINASAKK